MGAPARAATFAAAPDVLGAFRYAVGHAVLAPSGHNAQPWLFRVRDDTLWLCADRTRALHVADPEDRELVMSLGAALLHLRIAMRHLGYRPHVELHPDVGAPDLMARVALGERRAPTPEEDGLFQAIRRRRTNRGPFEERPLPQPLVRSLQGCAEAEGARLRIVRSEAEREAVADLIAEGDRIQGADPAFRRELARWIHSNRSRSRDGMPGCAFGAGDLASYLGPLVIRGFDWGRGQAAKDRELALAAPTLAVVTTDFDSPVRWLRAGQALTRVLLRAAAEDVSASFLNQPIEVAALRPRLAAALHLDGAPQLLLRMGYGGDAPPTPRRGVEEVLREA